MDMDIWRHRAIQNNMDWYCAEAATHGINYVRTAESWHTTQRVPPHHSNLVAIAADPTPQIVEIDSADIGPWSIKDALHQYNLQPLGFSTLFDAQWFAHPPGKAWPADPALGEVKLVRTPAQLTRWIDAWGETPDGSMVFVPGILDDPTVQLICLEREGVMLGGLATNKSSHVIGITNSFGPEELIGSCLAHVANHNPSLGLVGYDNGPALLHLERYGFTRLGELRIWHRTDS